MVGHKQPMGYGRGHIFATLVMLLLVGPAVGQDTGRIQGRVVDAADRTPMPAVRVMLVGRAQATLTDSTGRYAFDRLEPGLYQVAVDHVGFGAVSERLRLRPGQTFDLNFRLEARASQAPHLNVYHPTALQPRVTIGGQAETMPTGPDVGGMLRTLPGVEAVRRGALGLDPVVRATYGASLGLYVDGMPVVAGDPLRASPGLAPFDPTGLTRLDVVRGPYALLLGHGALAAVQAVAVGEAPAPGLRGLVQTGYDANPGGWFTAGTVTSASEGLTFGLHGTVRGGADYHGGDGTTIPASYRANSLRGRLQYDLQPDAQLHVYGGLARHTDVDNAGRDLNTAAADFADLSVRYRWQLENSDVLLQGVEAQLYVNAQQHVLNNDGKPTAEADTARALAMPLRIELNSDVTVVGGRALVHLLPLEYIQVTGGLDFIRRAYDADRSVADRNTGAVMMNDPVWPEARLAVIGLFGGVDFDFGDMTAVGTARFDFVQGDAAQTTDYFLDNAVPQDTLSARDLDARELDLSLALQVRLPLRETVALNIGMASAARTADVFDRFTDRFPSPWAHSNIELLGRPNVERERATMVDMWLDVQYPRWQVQVGGFARLMSDIVTFQRSNLQPQFFFYSDDRVYRFRDGEARFYGAEAFGFLAPHDDVALEGHAAVLLGRDVTADEPAYGVAPLTLDLGAKYTYPEFPVWGRLGVLYAHGQSRVAASRGEQPSTGYLRIDLMAGGRLPYDVDLQLGVTNLFDKAYAPHVNAVDPFTVRTLVEGEGDATVRQVVGDRILEPGRSLFVRLQRAF